MKAECPKDWYKEAEIRNWVKREGVPHERDLPAFLAKHLQLALEVGWRLRESDCRAHANECLEAAAKVVHEHKLRVGFGPGVEENLIQMIYRLYDDLEAAVRALKE